MTLGLATELPDAADEAQRYRHFATLILELGAALATHDHRDEIVIRDLATAIIVDTADGGFEPLARVRLSQIADLTTYFSSMANNYSLAHNMDFLFKPAS
jgi:hypothetical protein